LWLLVATLAIRPCALFRRGSVGSFNSVLIGLFVFFYATLHMLTWLGLYAGFDLNTMATDLTSGDSSLWGWRPGCCCCPRPHLYYMGNPPSSAEKLEQASPAHAISRTHAGVHYCGKVKTGVLSPATYTVVIWFCWVCVR